jgi:hypothetical protein
MRTHLQSAAACAAVLAAGALLFAEIQVPAAGIDSASAVRGSLGVTLQDLSLDDNLGQLSFVLNGGVALLSGVFACVAVVKGRRDSTSSRDRRDHRRSRDPMQSRGRERRSKVTMGA